MPCSGPKATNSFLSFSYQIKVPEESKSTICNLNTQTINAKFSGLLKQNEPSTIDYEQLTVTTYPTCLSGIKVKLKPLPDEDTFIL